MSNKISENIYNIIKKENKFLTLNEIYHIFVQKFGDCGYKNINAVIRHRIYDRCIDRDLRKVNKDPLFFSVFPKRTIGNQYGIIEWYPENGNDDISQKDIDNLIEHLPNRYDLQDVPIELHIDKFVNIRVYQHRKNINSLIALNNADFKCECDNKHESFIRKSNGKNYTEAHHLIPLKYQKDFKYCLDVPANIISLCSTCHNNLHYGINNKEILNKLYLLRKESLKKYKIYITFDKLFSMYK